MTQSGIIKAKSDFWVVRNPGGKFVVLDDATFDRLYDTA